MSELQTQEQVTTVSRSAPAQVTQTTKTVTPPVPTEHQQKVYQKKKNIFRTYQVIWYILGVIEVLVALRIALKMLGANVNSPFVSLIYIVTDPLALPFSGIFKADLTSEGAILEWSTLVGMAIYALIAFAIIQLLQLAKPTTPKEVEQKVDNP